jgi:hypothetical protein
VLDISIVKAGLEFPSVVSADEFIAAYAEIEARGSIQQALAFLWCD